MIVAIMQPTYIPWIGYFGMISLVDIFVFYDDVQFEKQSWQQRNKIVDTKGSEIWLSIPVFRNFGQTINVAKIDHSTNWRKSHLKSIVQSYSKAPYFDQYCNYITEFYDNEWALLGDYNIHIIKQIVDLIGLPKPTFIKSSTISGITGSKTDRLISLLGILGADQYITVPGTKAYLEKDKFAQKGIDLAWYEFPHPKYTQIGHEFIPYLSIVDLLFNAGPESGNIISIAAQSALTTTENNLI